VFGKSMMLCCIKTSAALTTSPSSSQMTSADAAGHKTASKRFSIASSDLSADQVAVLKVRLSHIQQFYNIQYVDVVIVVGTSRK